jgi:S1-C subfamily serine protease
VRSTVIRLPELRLGDVTVRDVVGELSDATFGSFSDANYEGNIGSALLKRFVVTFDYARARMYLKAIVPEPSDVGTFDKSGMWLNAESAGYVVTSLDERSPAGEAGLAAGDVITAIDGRAAQMRKLSDARATLRDLPAGTVVRVDFKRGAARKTADIKLRDLTNQK